MADFQRIIVNQLQYPIFTLKHGKDATYFVYETYGGKTLESVRMHENIFFLFFLFFFLMQFLYDFYATHAPILFFIIFFWGYFTIT